MEIGGFNEIVPLEDRVIIRPSQREEVTTSGIIIPDSGTEGPVRGEVIAVGPGRYDDGDLLPMQVKVGDTILFSKYGFDEVKVGGSEYFIVSSQSILAVLS